MEKINNKSTLDLWKKLEDKHDLRCFNRFCTLSTVELEQVREAWKEMRRFALYKLNKELNNSGKSGQLLSIDVSDDALYPYVNEIDRYNFFTYSRILDFDFGFIPKGLIVIKKGI